MNLQARDLKKNNCNINKEFNEFKENAKTCLNELNKGRNKILNQLQENANIWLKEIIKKIQDQKHELNKEVEVL